MSYLWSVIIYLFDYFVNYLSIELLIHPHDKAWIMHDLIWDYCIQMHIVAVRDRVRMSHVEIKSPSLAVLSSFDTEAETGFCKNISRYQNKSHCIYLTCSDLLHTWCVSVCMNVTANPMHYLSGERKVFISIFYFKSKELNRFHWKCRLWGRHTVRHGEKCCQTLTCYPFYTLTRRITSVK